MKFFYIFIFFITFNATATKWIETTVSDPLNSEAECTVNEVMSSGSYIFDWASKYDQIFFPYTSSAAIWFCADSGYISFMEDFEGITSEEKVKIAAYLEKNPQKNIKTLLSKLKLIETIYSFRNISPEVSNRNKRILAYLYEQKKKFEIANNYRRAALSQIYELLKKDLTKYKRLEYLYVAANYERQLGHISNSDVRLTTLLNEIENIQDEELKGFGKYLLKLSSETILIKPGGILEPVTKKEITHKEPNKIDTWIDDSSMECRTEIQIIFANLKPMLIPNTYNTVVDKSIGELLMIREEFIDTGGISKQSFDNYSFYKGVDTTFKHKINEWKAKISKSCKNEVNTFTNRVLLDYHQHIERVVNDIASDLGSIRNKFEEQEISESRAAIDNLLIDNNIRFLYCYVSDYDVSEHQVCTDKSLPYKHIFKKVKSHILKLPLKVSDETDIQKLYRGFDSIGI